MNSFFSTEDFGLLPKGIEIGSVPKTKKVRVNKNHKSQNKTNLLFCGCYPLRNLDHAIFFSFDPNENDPFARAVSSTFSQFGKKLIKLCHVLDFWKE